MNSNNKIFNTFNRDFNKIIVFNKNVLILFNRKL